MRIESQKPFLRCSTERTICTTSSFRRSRDKDAYNMLLSSCPLWIYACMCDTAAPVVHGLCNLGISSAPCLCAVCGLQGLRLEDSAICRLCKVWLCFIKECDDVEGYLAQRSSNTTSFNFPPEARQGLKFLDNPATGRYRGWHPS